MPAHYVIDAGTFSLAWGGSKFASRTLLEMFVFAVRRNVLVDDDLLKFVVKYAQHRADLLDSDLHRKPAKTGGSGGRPSTSTMLRKFIESAMSDSGLNSKSHEFRAMAKVVARDLDLDLVTQIRPGHPTRHAFRYQMACEIEELIRKNMSVAEALLEASINGITHPNGKAIYASVEAFRDAYYFYQNIPSKNPGDMPALEHVLD